MPVVVAIRKCAKYNLKLHWQQQSGGVVISYRYDGVERRTISPTRNHLEARKKERLTSQASSTIEDFIFFDSFKLKFQTNSEHNGAIVILPFLSKEALSHNLNFLVTPRRRQFWNNAVRNSERSTRLTTCTAVHQRQLVHGNDNTRAISN